MTAKPTDAAALMLGITKQQIVSMQKRIDTLERENDAIALAAIVVANSARPSRFRRN